MIWVYIDSLDFTKLAIERAHFRWCLWLQLCRRPIRRLLRKCWARWTSPLAPLPFLVGGDAGRMKNLQWWLMVGFPCRKLGLHQFGTWHIFWGFSFGTHWGPPSITSFCPPCQSSEVLKLSRSSNSPSMLNEQEPWEQTKTQKNMAKKKSAQPKNKPFTNSTHLCHGRPSPLLITKDAVSSMKAGSVIVDLVPQWLSRSVCLFGDGSSTGFFTTGHGICRLAVFFF